MMDDTLENLTYGMRRGSLSGHIRVLGQSAKSHKEGMPVTVQAGLEVEQ
ncbi:hypothetical protein [Paenibacillus brevis]|uniref:Uncharacterized protein n=1 Tax=Paenibacillus brevis TaxID=2841508 RepID=A0ABS6FT67_9BACL|nr:hypothetical protein [Paenibacillus brevis]MBU5673304.1 hypothetical protein [Paenibacillus brevis]